MINSSGLECAIYIAHEEYSLALILEGPVTIGFA